jgi:hypothetical protein
MHHVLLLGVHAIGVRHLYARLMHHVLLLGIHAIGVRHLYARLMHHVLLLGVHDCPITRTIPLPDWSIMTNERINCWQPGSKKRFRCQLIESDSGHETHGDLRKRYRTDRHRDHQHDDGPRTRAVVLSLFEPE